MKRDEPQISVYCAGCSRQVSVPEHIANGPNPVYCSDACQMDQEHLQYLNDDERRDFRASPCNTGDYLED